MSKKLIVTLMVLSVVISLSSSLYAGCSKNMGGDCGNCNKSSSSSDPWKKFQADTIDLRQEMMMKRFELQRENLKPLQDQNNVALLQSEIKKLQTKIHDIRTASGLPADKCDGECGSVDRNCGKKGMGGCNGIPCSGK
jgi:hypothetical protein